VIAANKLPWLDAMLYLYFRRMWRKAFQGVYLRGSPHLEGLPADRPIIAYANHTNWWDLLMVFRLTRVLSTKKFYGMMEEKQLRPYRFFSWIGAFSVDLSAPGRAAAGLRYAVKLLREPQSLVWLFPQGKLCSPYEPFSLQPGLEFLIKHAPQATILPWAFRYEFLRDDRPVVLLEVGTPLSAEGATTGKLQEACEILCQRLLEVARASDLSEFQCLETPSLTINKRWEYCLCVLRGRLQEFDPRN
jgi:1-acyl-sn-glycerol-3-phosphate acyltransferase